MKLLMNVINKASTKAGFITLLILYVVVFGSVLVTLSELHEVTGGVGILDFDRGYDHERVMAVFGSYGETGMELYLRIQLLDLINPILYSLLFASLIYVVFKRENRLSKLAIIPLIAGLFDYAENAALFTISRNYPDVSSELVGLSSALNIVKTIALVGSLLVFYDGYFLVVPRTFN